MSRWFSAVRMVLMFVPSPYSDGTKRGAISIFIWVAGPLDRPPPSRMRAVTSSSPMSKPCRNLTFASTVFLLASFLGAKTCCYSYEWNGREITKILLAQVLTPSSEAAWTNRVEQDWPLKQKRNANKGSNTKTSLAKYLGWTNKSGSTEATQSSTIARCQRTSVSNIRTNDSQAAGSPPWKWLRQKQKQRRNQRQQHFYKIIHI